MLTLVTQARSVSLLAIVLLLLMGGCGTSHSVSCAGPGGANCPIAPGPEFLYASSNSNGGQILTFTVDHSSGALGGPATTIGPAMSAGIASAQNQFLYVTDADNGVIDAFSVSQTAGALTPIPGSPFSASPLFPLALVAGTDLYSTGFTGTSGFSIATNGALTPVLGSPFSGGIGGQAALGQLNTTSFLYATDFTDPNGTISAFKVDPVLGTLTAIAGPFTTGVFAGPDGIVFDVSTLGQFVFVALNAANQVAAFSVDSTGALTPAPGSPFDAGISPVFLALSASQNFLYAMNFGDQSISAYSIAGTGALTPVPGSPFMLADAPGAMVVTGDDFLYVSLPKSNSILGFTIAANGALAPLSGSPFSASAPGLLTTIQIPPP